MPTETIPAAEQRFSRNTEPVPAPAALQRPAITSAMYWLSLFATYFLVGGVFFYSAKEKLIDGDIGAPAYLVKQFDGTLIDTFPGTDAAWVIIAVLEAAVFALLLVSLVAREFLPNRSKPILLAALGLSLVVFASLSFGESASRNYEGVASAFTYFGLTAVLILLVSMLSPGRSFAGPQARSQD